MNSAFSLMEEYKSDLVNTDCATDNTIRLNSLRSFEAIKKKINSFNENIDELMNDACNIISEISEIFGGRIFTNPQEYIVAYINADDNVITGLVTEFNDVIVDQNSRFLIPIPMKLTAEWVYNGITKEYSPASGIICSDSERNDVYNNPSEYYTTELRAREWCYKKFRKWADPDVECCPESLTEWADGSSASMNEVDMLIELSRLHGSLHVFFDFSSLQNVLSSTKSKFKIIKDCAVFGDIVCTVNMYLEVDPSATKTGSLLLDSLLSIILSDAWGDSMRFLMWEPAGFPIAMKMQGLEKKVMKACKQNISSSEYSDE